VHSNNYTLGYAAAVTALVGATLAVAVSGLKPLQERNTLMANRRAILQTVMPVNPAALAEDYGNYIVERVFDAAGNEVRGVEATSLSLKDEARKPLAEQRLPLFVFSRDGATRYIVPMQGNGLWGPISAYLALEKDLSTIFGVVFSHEKETPGLGAEIAQPAFQDRYAGKRIYREDGTLEPVAVLRGTGNDTSGLPHAVDGITGATITVNGVTRMFRDELSRYSRIFEALRRNQEKP
jgi:Na+-transporting NADH:ubiquinone oxidoreductase subunit C